MGIYQPNFRCSSAATVFAIPPAGKSVPKLASTQELHLYRWRGTHNSAVIPHVGDATDAEDD